MSGNDDGGLSQRELNCNAVLVVVLVACMFALPFIAEWATRR
jgi:hypothetical protein